MARLPLRMQLTLWFLVIFSVIYILLSAAVWVIGSGSQRRILDEGLISLSQGVAELLVKFEGDVNDIDLRPYQPVDREFSLLAVRDSNGVVLSHDIRVVTDALPPVPSDSTINTITDIDGEVARKLVGREIATRMVTHRLITRKNEVRFIDMARTTDIGRRQRLFFSDILFVAGLGGLISCTIAAWILLGRATSPFMRLAEAARRVGPGEARLQLESGAQDVDRLQTELNEALDRIEAGHKEQQKFLSNVAHDLKTPISVMLTQSQVLPENDTSVENFHEYRNSMIEELLRLRGIIEGILALSRAEQGDGMLRRQDLEVKSLVAQSAARCNAQAQEASVQLVATGPGTNEVVHGDVDLLATMLDNLVRNAIRFSPEGGTVEVSADREDGQARIAVRDRGPGIPEAYIRRIFDRFVQVPSTTRFSRGTGLGLAIAKAVTDAHRGSIAVRNRTGGGCEFTVRLPLK
jgi:signal transduction histidine kinase